MGGGGGVIGEREEVGMSGGLQREKKEVGWERVKEGKEGGKGRRKWMFYSF